MSSYWIKLHDSVLENEIWQDDPTAWHLFEFLLIKAYKGTPQGTVRTTRYKIGNELSGNSSTYWKALLRLENAKMVTHVGTAKYTVITICKWHQYQSSEGQLQGQLKDSSRTAQGHSYKNKIKNIDTNVSSRVSDETTTHLQKLYELYLQEFDTTELRFKLTPARKAKLRLRVKDAGYDLVAQAIRNTAASAWHRGENDRGWRATLDFIVRSYEQVEKLAAMEAESNIDRDAEELRKKWMHNE